MFLSDKLVDVAEQILGPDVALFTSYIVSKPPRVGLAVIPKSQRQRSVLIHNCDLDTNTALAQGMPGEHHYAN